MTQEAQQGTRIIQLDIENVKRLSAISLSPEGDLIVIGGKNGAGKSSVLDSIMYALAGKKAIPAEPLRRGAKKGEVVVDLGEIVIKRTFTAKGGELIVTSKDGLIHRSPQAILDKLFGDLSFDPVSFQSMKPADQLILAKKIAGVSFDDLDARLGKITLEKQELNREARNAEAKLVGLEKHKDVPLEPVSIQGLVKELEEAEGYNTSIGVESLERDIEAARNSIAGNATSLDECETQIAELRRQWEVITARQATLRAQNVNLLALIDERQGVIDNAQPIDVGPIKESMANAETINAAIRKNQEIDSLIKVRATTTSRITALTLAQEQVKEDKAKLLAEANFPVPGLSFGDEGLLLNDLPFEQASSAEQLRVSVAMGMSLNPTLKVILIRDGSLLDDDNLKLVAEMAQERGYQIWIERVGKGKECSVIIEDGAVEGSVSDG